MASYEFVVDADPEHVRDLAREVVDAAGFDASWRDEWNASVQRGSRVRSVLLGAFAPHVRVDLAVRSLDDEGRQSVLRLDNRASGLLGGVMGAQKSRAGWNSLRDELAEHLRATGQLVEERDPGPSRIV